MSKIFRNLKTKGIKLLKRPLLKLGFINYYHSHIHGKKERLIYDSNYPLSLSNTIFNTRSGKIELGKYILFGHNCMVLTGKHNYLDALDNIEKIYEVPDEGRDIKIGDGTWITSGCIILGNITIGKHCVVMAGSVVTKDIPDYSIVAGIPAKIIDKNEIAK